MMKRYKTNPFLEFEPFQIVSGNQGFFDPFSDEELEYMLEVMISWEHYQSAGKIKKALDKRKVC